MFNQIDYIICQFKHKQTLTNSRSYSNLNTDSNHRIVITDIEIELHRINNNRKKAKISRLYNSHLLASDKEVQTKYSNVLSEALRDRDKNWKEIQKTIQEVAKTEVGYRRRVAERGRIFNQDIEELSKIQNNLRQRIVLYKVTQRTNELKRERNRICHAIRNLIKDERDEKLNNELEELNQLQGNARMFKAVKELHREQLQNPTVNDKTEKH